MAEDHTISETSREAVSKVTGNENLQDMDKSIQALLWLIMFEGTSNLRKKKLNELRKLTTSQSEIGFLSNLRRIFMLGANEDGTFTVNDDLKNLLSKVAEPGSEGLMQLLDDLGLPFKAKYDEKKFRQLFQEIEQLEDDSTRQTLKDKLSSLGISADKSLTQQEIDSLIAFVKKPENTDLRKLLINNGIITTKENFTKVERDNFIESIRLAVEQKSTLNEMSIQTVNRLDTEIDQMRQYVIMGGKTYSDILKEIARKTSGR